MKVGSRDVCGRCDALITLAADGAWEDESGACGCGDGEHEPSSGRGQMVNSEVAAECRCDVAGER